MAVQPVGERVLVKVLEESADQMVGGIYLPTTVQKTIQRGEVIAVGDFDGKTPPYQVGDTLMFHASSGTLYKEGGDEFLFLKADEVFAVVRE